MKIVDLSRLRESISKVGPHQLTMGRLIAALESAPPTNRVYYDFCYDIPGDWMSYRGYYEDLALDRKGQQGRTVADLLMRLKLAIGSEMEGYKGGTYEITEDTPVWVSDYGTTSSTYVRGVASGDYSTFLLTGNADSDEVSGAFLGQEG